MTSVYIFEPMLTWSISSRELPLRYTWKISRNATDAKTNLFVSVNSPDPSGSDRPALGEAAPNIRYNETPDGLLADWERIKSDLPAKQIPLTEFTALLDGLHLPSALRFAVESAYIHYLAAAQNIPVYALLSLPAPAPVATAFSLPIMPLGELADFIAKQNIGRFRYIKIKVHRENAAEVVNCLAEMLPQPLLVDANESFKHPDEVLQFLEQTDAKRLVMLEQPLPAAMRDEYTWLKSRMRVPLFADESITDNMDISELKKGFHGINMKLMKAGGYLRGMEQLRAAREAGLQTMIGCMVETTLGIMGALQLSSLADYTDLDGFLIIQDEPFELIQEKGGFLRAAGNFVRE